MELRAVTHGLEAAGRGPRPLVAPQRSQVPFGCPKASGGKDTPGLRSELQCSLSLYATHTRHLCMMEFKEKYRAVAPRLLTVCGRGRAGRRGGREKGDGCEQERQGSRTP